MTAQGRPGGTPRGTRQHPSAGPRTRSYSTWLKAAAHPRDRAGGPFATREMGLGSLGPARGHVGAEKVAAKWQAISRASPRPGGGRRARAARAAWLKSAAHPRNRAGGPLSTREMGLGSVGPARGHVGAGKVAAKWRRIFTGARCRSGGEVRRAGAAENGRAPVRSHWEAVVHR